MTSKHHDGYALWPSKYSYSWNSVDIGPHRNIISELSDAIRTNTSLRFGLYHSLLEWFHPLYLSDKQNLFDDNKFVVNKVSKYQHRLFIAYKFAIDGATYTFCVLKCTDYFSYQLNVRCRTHVNRYEFICSSSLLLIYFHFATLKYCKWLNIRNLLLCLMNPLDKLGNARDA